MPRDQRRRDKQREVEAKRRERKRREDASTTMIQARVEEVLAYCDKGKKKKEADQRGRERSGEIEREMAKARREEELIVEENHEKNVELMKNVVADFWAKRGILQLENPRPAPWEFVGLLEFTTRLGAERNIISKKAAEEWVNDIFLPIVESPSFIIQAEDLFVGKKREGKPRGIREIVFYLRGKDAVLDIYFVCASSYDLVI